MCYKNTNKRTGSAIAVSLALATVVFIFLGMTISSSIRQNAGVIQNILPFQAKLMAISGIQHFLLKAKLIPTAFYDAWALANGRNPLFNFAIDAPVAGSSNPGPRFITAGKLGDPPEMYIAMNPADNFSTDLNGWFSSNAFSDNKWPTMQDKPVRNSHIYMWKFAADVTNGPEIQSAISFQRKNKEAYDGEYSVADISIAAQKGRETYQEDTVVINVIGTVTNEKGNMFSQSIKQIVNIARR